MTHLTKLLEVMFEYMYPRKLVTTLDQSLDSDKALHQQFMLIAEAAEKYQVYALMAVCIAYPVETFPWPVLRHLQGRKNVCFKIYRSFLETH